MSHNTLIHRIIRPVVRLAARTPLKPNHVTTARLITGLAAAACFSIGARDWMIVGGMLFTLSMLLDRADGELARLTQQTSLTGYRYDLACDCIASIATFIGLGAGLTAEVGPMSLWLGLTAGLGIGVLFLELNVLKVASVTGHDLFGGRVTVDPDDAMVMIPILVWCGLTWPMLIAASVITPLAAAGVGARGLRRQTQ